MNTTAPVRRIRNARLADGGRVDLVIEEGRVTRVDPASTMPAADFELDAGGMLALASGVEPHAHVDKALVFDEIEPSYGGLAEGIARWQAHARDLDEDDFVRRGAALLRSYLANGVTAVRTHAEIFPSADPLRSVRAMVRLRRMFAGALDLEIAVLPKNSIPDAVIAQALDTGADLVGGSPHNTDDPAAELERLLRIARARGAGIDIHADERLDPASLTVLQLARAVAQDPLRGSVTASHCVSLGVVEAEAVGAIIAEIAEAGVGVIACPATNLYLQARDRLAWTPRGITAARALLEHGATLAGGGDNVRDTLNPMGGADHLATAALLVLAAHLTVEQAHDAVTAGARSVMRLPEAGPFEGAVADLLLIDAPTLGSALADPSGGRITLRRGRVVARRAVETSVFVPA
jgi:cytosine deaminase